MPRSEDRFRPTAAVLVATPESEPEAAAVHASLDELARLLAPLGIRAADRMVARRRSGRRTLGEGKLEELRGRIAALAPAEVRVVVDGALEPGPHRDLEGAVGVPVLDRPGVILRLFERRARTRLAKLEVELARLTYELPRLREGSSGDDRMGGGGRGGRGHTNVELDKQAIRDRRAALAREIERLHRARATQAARRDDIPQVALVGYTNAGKSSLVRALTGADVLVEDALFATLDPTVRALSPETTPRILISDTVGFVRNLPHDLVASFRSTLDEARAADLLLVVVDASDPEWRAQLEVVDETLEAIGVTTPSRLVFNKIDRLDDAERSALERERPEAIAATALSDAGAVREAIVAFFTRDDEADVLVVPFDQPRVLADIRGRARVLDERYGPDGAVLALRARPEDLRRWRQALPARPPITSPEELLSRAHTYGLSLAADDPSFDASGLDFLVVHATDEQGRDWIVRTPRRPDVVDSAQREARVLRLVRSALAVDVPEWRLHAQDVIAYLRLEGTPGWTLDASGALSWALDPKAPPEPFLDSYASTVAALWTIPAHRVLDAGVRIETVEAARSALRRAMEETRDVLDPPAHVWARWQRFVADGATWPTHAALVHGDLHPGHMLLDADGHITAILDWTEAHVTDPSIDLALFAGCFGREALEAVVDRLADAGAATWPGLVEHALERWAAYPALVAEWALATRSDPALAHAKHLVEAVAAETDRG